MSEKSRCPNPHCVFIVATLGGSPPPASLTTSPQSVAVGPFGPSKTSKRCVTHATTTKAGANHTVWNAPPPPRAFEIKKAERMKTIGSSPVHNGKKSDGDS